MFWKSGNKQKKIIYIKISLEDSFIVLKWTELRLQEDQNQELIFCFFCILAVIFLFPKQ